MSHINITMRDRYSLAERTIEELITTRAKLQHTENLLKDAESNLSSIFERVKDGEEVYLSYPDGSIIPIGAVPPRPASG